MLQDAQNGATRLQKMSTGTKGVHTGKWPWEERQAIHSDEWDVDAIREHLNVEFAKQGIVADVRARDSLGALAEAHFQIKAARRAIAHDPISPHVGKMCAYAVINRGYFSIQKAMAIIGASPLIIRQHPGEVTLEGASNYGTGPEPLHFEQPAA